MFKRCEASRIAYAVLQCSEERLDERIVIRDTGTAVAQADAEAVQKGHQGDSFHWAAVVGMDELGSYAKIADHSLKEFLGILGIFSIVNRPADNRSVKEVFDDIGELEESLHVGSQPGDVPRPHLVGPVATNSGRTGRLTGARLSCRGDRAARSLRSR